MRKYGLIWASALLVAFFANTSHAQLDSQGKDFFLTFHSNIVGNARPGVSLFISSEKGASGSVVIDKLDFRENFSVLQNESIRVDLPLEIRNHESDAIDSSVVRVTADEEVRVYGLNKVQYSSDAFLGLPIHALGQEYLILNYHLQYYDPSELTVTAPYDDTEITILPSVSYDSWAEGVPYKVLLDSGQTYAFESSVDMTGTVITSNKPVGVMSSAWCTSVPMEYAACDHIVEMLPPVSTWGKEYLTVPLATRKKGDFFRFLASQDNTFITVNGEREAMLNRGEFHEMVIIERAEIIADKPIMVMQYSASSSFDGVISDPFMMLVPPAGQYLSDYTFETLPKDQGFINGFVNVTIPTSDIGSVVLNGAPVDATQFTSIGSSEFSGAQIELPGGVHTISASVPLGISVYGFGSYDSYGYPGGMAFERINSAGDSYDPFIKLMSMGDTIEGLAGDFEDLNFNGLIDLGEDLNGNNILDQRTEDLNGNNTLDPGEDLNGDGVLDRDRGVFSIELEPGSDNLQLDVASFVPGSLQTSFTISLINSNLIGFGVLVVKDGAGNETRQPIQIDNTATFQNVVVTSTLSANDIEIDPGSFARTPDHIRSLADSTEVEWRFLGFEIDQIEDLSYEVILKNPVPNETRLVTQSLVLTYLDANGNEVKRELGEQTVEVLASLFDIDVSTDKPKYTPKETVKIAPLVSNLSDFDNKAIARVYITDLDANLVEDFGVFSDFSVQAKASRQISGLQFDASGVLAGKYRVVAEILNDKNEVIVQDVADFEISVDVDLVGALRTTTNRSIYHTTDVVEISDLARNLSSNQIIKGANLELTVIDPNGKRVFENTHKLGDLTAGGSQLKIDTYGFDTIPTGSYQVEGKLTDGQGTLLATDSASFSVVDDLSVSISGDVQASVKLVEQGDSLNCTDTLRYTGEQALSNLPIRQVLIDVDKGTLINQQQSNVNVQPASNHILVRGVNTANLAEATYACALQAELEGQWQTLDTDFFAVEIKPVALQLRDDYIDVRRGAWGTAKVLENDTYEDKTQLTVSLIQNPKHGRVVNAGKGIYNYFPNFTYLGSDQFRYQVRDAVTGGVQTATVYADVVPGISCSVVPDHSTQSKEPVNLPGWAKTARDTYDPPRYKISLLSTSSPDAFLSQGQPNIDYPACSLSYTPKPGIKETVTVTYQVTDVATGGAKYTSRDKTFTLTIDTLGLTQTQTLIIPILKLLLLDKQ